jgi:hypothetical protein
VQLRAHGNRPAIGSEQRAANAAHLDHGLEARSSHPTEVRDPGRLEILYDFSREYRGVGQVVGVFQGFVAEPGDVEAELVAFLQIFVVEAAEAFGLFAFVSVGRVVAGDEFSRSDCLRLLVLSVKCLLVRRS